MAFFAFVVGAYSTTIVAGEFGQFRGSAGTGVVEGQDLPKSWGPDDNLAWKIAVPGAGWSQPVIHNGRLYVTAAVSDKELKPRNFADGVKSPSSMGLGFMARAPKLDIKWTVFCYDSSNGKLLWDRVVDSGNPKFAIHPSNTYATESPVVNKNGVYVFFASTGKVAGLGLDGQLRWQRDIGTFKTSNNFGTGSSLAMHDGKIYVQSMTEGSADVFCFDCETGNEVWKDSRKKSVTSWTSPIIWSNNLRTELVVATASQIIGYEPETGRRLWTLENVKGAASGSPCSDANRIYFGSSDPFSKGPLVAMNAGGNGDLSPKKANSEFESCAWLIDRAGPGMASPVSNGKYLYVVERNILRCYDANTGKRIYQNRIPNMSMVAACPVVVGDQLFVVDEDGQGSLLAVGPEFKVMGSGKVEDTVWASPAITDDSIFVRGVDYLYCFRK